MQATAAKNLTTQRALSERAEKLAPSVLCLVFLFALALRLWFNFGAEHTNCYASCDASEYLRNAQALLALARLPGSFFFDCLACLTGAADAQTWHSVRSGFAVLGEMHQSGPVFPLFLIAAWAISGAAPEFTSWQPLLAAQSLLSALCCVLIALIAAHAFDRRVALTAALVAAVYPGFIVNSGRLYSESFSVFWLCCLIWLAVRGFKEGGNSAAACLLAGVSAAVLQLTRSVMFVLTLALAPLTCLQRRGTRPIVALLAFFAGLALIFLPWLAVQKLAFGKSSLVVDRVGHYNFFIGNNTDTQGWLSYPYPDGRGIETKSFPHLLRESFKKSPERWVKLMLDKPVRLLKSPWNDFRVPIGPFGYGLQVAFHQLLLVMAAIGLVLNLATDPQNQPGRRKLYARLLILSVALTHCLYLLFITVPRYNLTAMPEIIIFAGAGAVALARLVAGRPWSLAPWAVLFSAAALFATARADVLSACWRLPLCHAAVLALAAECLAKTGMLLLFAAALWSCTSRLEGSRAAARIICALLAAGLFPSYCLPVRAHGRWYEWEQLLLPGQAVSQAIQLPADLKTPYRRGQWYVMIDSDGAEQLATGTTVKVNGVPIAGPVIPSLALVPDMAGVKRHDKHALYRECEYIFDCLTASTGISNRDLRQWFLLPVPKACLDNSRGTAVIELIRTGASALKLFGAYPISRSFELVPSPTLYSWEKAFYGVENDAGLTDTRYDMKLAKAAAAHEPPPPAETASRGKFFLCLVHATADSTTPPTPPEVLKSTNLAPLSVSPDCAVRRAVTIGAAPFNRCELWVIRLKGLAKVSSSGVVPALEATVRLRNGDSYTSPWASRNLGTSTDWTPFDLSIPLEPAILPDKPASIDLKFLARRSGSTGGDSPDLSEGCVEFSDVNAEIVRLSGNPLKGTMSIY